MGTLDYTLFPCAQFLFIKIVGYEVFIIQMEPDTTLYDKFYPAHELWPRFGDWGKTAWSCFTLEEAMLKYNRIEL